jgi:carbonic anhydrase/acetyltransferase-like protein (isoleucine patch superfamily)
VRGDVNFVKIGDRTNVQDNSVIHVTYEKFPTVIASNVTIGHAAIIHGCSIEDFCLIGMGAILLDGSSIGEHSLVAAGSLVREGFTVPARSLVAGVPARVVRELKDEELRRLEESARHYVDYVSNYRLRSLS